MNSTESERFSAELIDPLNKRILFSAPFGAGKSYFLEKYFKNSDDYNFINLYPVDYSVTSNDDIFEIIKFDVLEALLARYSNEIKLTEEDLSQALITQEFLRNEVNYYEVFKVFAKYFPGGEAVTDGIDVLKKQFDEHNTFSEKMKRKPSDNAADFIRQIRKTKNSIRELDEVSLMIKSFVERVIEANQKRFILIVDDLDRLDPDHIFRIINVFTAHHNSKTELNKFGFDKVVFVCDVNNIEHMFKHRFGPQADFTGYIDKFYSKNIFEFDGRSFLKEVYYDDFIKSKRYLDEDNFNLQTLRKLNDGSSVIDGFKRIVNDLIDIDAIRIRSILKFQALKLPTNKVVLYGMQFQSAYHDFLVLIFLLRQLMPRLSDLKDSIAKLASDYVKKFPNRVVLDEDEAFAELIARSSFPFLFPETSLVRHYEEGGKVFNFNDGKNIITIEVSLSRDFNSQFPKVDVQRFTRQDGSKANLNPYYFLLGAVEVSNKLGMIS